MGTKGERVCVDSDWFGSVTACFYGAYLPVSLIVANYFMLASKRYSGDEEAVFMLMKLTTRRLFPLVAALLCVSSVATVHAGSEEEMAAKMALLEKRLAELESRLAENEQETKEVKVLAANSTTDSGAANPGILGNAMTYDILANSAWRNLRWTQEEQWEGIRKGITVEEVEAILGHPPRTVESLKPRIDLVYYYETSIRDRANSLRGKVSFNKGVVIAVTKPDFRKNQSEL